MTSTGSDPASEPEARQRGPRVAHLGRPGGDAGAFAALGREFAARNPGYGLTCEEDLGRLEAGPSARVLFVCSGIGVARVEDDLSPVAVGDAIVLRPGQELAVEADPGGSSPGLAVLAFRIPEVLPADLPVFLRPDADPRLGDVAGGCAEQAGSYRRMLLTWGDSRSPYRFRGLNAHRVRMVDSFTHYHPENGGFDEFYLVQAVAPEGRLFTCRHPERLERSESLTPADAAQLLQVHSLTAGDVVYLPRGIAHRAVGGVLAQIVTVPGFRPGAEIGIDHHLRALNRRLGLAGDRALPYNERASAGPIVK